MNQVNQALRGRIVTLFRSQVAFAEKSGIPENALSYIINGHRQPTQEQLIIFEKLLEVSREKLFGEEILYA